MPRVQGGKTSRKKLGHAVQNINDEHLGVDDVQSVIENLLVLCALLLGFCVTMCLQSIETTDLIRADEEYMKGERTAGEPNFFGLVSVDYFMSGNTTMLIFFVILWFAIMLEVSFRFSHARSDPVIFNRWWYVGRFGIGLCYVLVAVGIYFFCETVHAWQMITFPRYAELDYDARTLYNPERMGIDGQYKGGMDYDPDKMDNLLFHNMSKIFELGIYTFFVCCGVVVFFIHFLWVEYNCLRKEGPDEYADEIDAQELEAQGARGSDNPIVRAYLSGKISAREVARKLR